jgi:probable selenium-dependent hydroxylase accessory protein YqeC
MELEAFSPGICSLTGGGGKTTLLFALGRAFAAAGHGVLGTTTTRMYRPEPDSAMGVLFPEDPASIAAPVSGFLFAAKNPPPGGDAAKVYGYAPEDVDALFARNTASRILVEADGAAGRPLKAPAEHEPVIPGTTRAVIAVVGLSCFLAPFGPETVFRPERVTVITGLLPGNAVTPEAVAALTVHPEGLFKNTPPGASRLLFCNQADLPGAREAGNALAAILARKHPGFLRGLYIGSLHKEGLQCRSMPTM